MLSGKVMTIRLIAGQIKKISLYKMTYKLKLNSCGRNKMKVELDLSYATKFGLKGATGIFHLDFAKKADLASLQPNTDKLNIGKLKTGPANLKKLSNVINNDVVKKIVYGELVKKVNTID